ncbi:MAG: LamG domain-containing protein [Myxococcales bacterium]|nr:LamG domain-containing protein [Myxococcales bacterium]
MRAWAAVVVGWVAACGINPAYDDRPASTSGATTGTPPIASTSATTGAPPAPTTSAGDPTDGLDGGGDTSTSTTTSSTGTTGTTSSTATGTTDALDTGSSSGDATGGLTPGACDVADPALIACYRFEEDPPNGALIDGSMYAHHGTRAGTNSVASFTGFGKAGDLLGGSDVHVSTDPDFVPPQLTVALVVFVKQGQIGKGLVHRDGAYSLSLGDGTIKCRIDTEGGNLEQAVDIDEERWYHFACTYDGDKMTLHGHGLEFNPSPVSVGLTGKLIDKPGAELTIGRLAGDDSTKYSGWIDQVMIFNRVLEHAEICELAGELCPE